MLGPCTLQPSPSLPSIFLCVGWGMGKEACRSTCCWQVFCSGLLPCNLISAPPIFHKSPLHFFLRNVYKYQNLSWICEGKLQWHSRVQGLIHILHARTPTTQLPRAKICANWNTILPSIPFALMNVESPSYHHQSTATACKDLCKDLFPQTTCIQPVEQMKKLSFAKESNVHDCRHAVAMMTSIIKLSSTLQSPTCPIGLRSESEWTTGSHLDSQWTPSGLLGVRVESRGTIVHSDSTQTPLGHKVRKQVCNGLYWCQ